MLCKLLSEGNTDMVASLLDMGFPHRPPQWYQTYGDRHGVLDTAIQSGRMDVVNFAETRMLGIPARPAPHPLIRQETVLDLFPPTADLAMGAWDGLQMLALQKGDAAFLDFLYKHYELSVVSPARAFAVFCRDDQRAAFDVYVATSQVPRMNMGIIPSLPPPYRMEPLSLPLARWYKTQTYRPGLTHYAVDVSNAPEVYDLLTAVDLPHIPPGTLNSCSDAIKRILNRMHAGQIPVIPDSLLEDASFDATWRRYLVRYLGRHSHCGGAQWPLAGHLVRHGLIDIGDSCAHPTSCPFLWLTHVQLRGFHQPALCHLRCPRADRPTALRRAFGGGAHLGGDRGPPGECDAGPFV